MIRIFAVLAIVAVSACAGPTYHQVSLVNRTDRVIREIYIAPVGEANHGASRATLAPNASATVKVRAGNIEVSAVSEKIRIDETTTETRKASQVLELRGPLEIVFHDADKVPAGINGPNTRAIMFQITPEASAP